jgi:hypothetical protein
VLARYRATHLSAAERTWADAGEAPLVVSTPLGRIGLASAADLAVPESVGLLQTLRADVVAAPAGGPSPLKVEIDPRLYAIADPPTGRADLHPYLAAKLGQFWLVSGGRQGGSGSSTGITGTAAGIYGPEPVVSTPTLTAAPGAEGVRWRTPLPSPGTWINQQQLINGQRNDLSVPLVLDASNGCFQAWKRAGHGLMRCP